MTMMLRGAVPFVLLLSSALGCDDSPKSDSGPAASASAPAGELTEELAQRVLAKVGDEAITLGDFALALERLDRFERLRYQTPERRKTLLDEMINVELLAREAEKRGLHEQPETRAHVRVLQREEMLRRLRAELPALEELPPSEVRRYYDEHPAEFDDPARRRVAVIRVPSKATAEKIIEQCKGADAKRWGELAREHARTVDDARGASKNDARPPLELEGDLGLISAPGLERGENFRVPEPVRVALFQITQQGEVHPAPVEYGGAYYVVRLVGESPARRRTFSEAEATIRARLLQQRLREAERALTERLRQEIPVSIDEARLRELSVSLKDPASVGTASGTEGRKP